MSFGLHVTVLQIAALGSEKKEPQLLCSQPSRGEAGSAHLCHSPWSQGVRCTHCYSARIRLEQNLNIPATPVTQPQCITCFTTLTQAVTDEHLVTAW